MRLVTAPVGIGVLLPHCLPDGKLAAEPDASALARAPEIKGDLLLIFGTRDPHTPEAGRQVVRPGVQDKKIDTMSRRMDYRGCGDPHHADNAGS